MLKMMVSFIAGTILGFLGQALFGFFGMFVGSLGGMIVGWYAATISRLIRFGCASPSPPSAPRCPSSDSMPSPLAEGPIRRAELHEALI